MIKCGIFQFNEFMHMKYYGGRFCSKIFAIFNQKDVKFFQEYYLIEQHIIISFDRAAVSLLFNCCQLHI